MITKRRLDRIGRKTVRMLGDHKRTEEGDFLVFSVGVAYGLDIALEKQVPTPEEAEAVFDREMSFLRFVDALFCSNAPKGPSDPGTEEAE